ncbi:MAG TPA: metallophosphoesterase, partial [Prolixibacteraceae bacterium]|nr:metallophosphoesterase [Prolixibacteraceae bacterium]
MVITKRIFFLLIISLNFCSYTIGQNIEIIGESIEISLNGVRSGNIQWQFSNDSRKWIDVVGAKSEVLSYKVRESGQFRAKVTDGNCSYFSDPTAIEAFNFNLRDENGNPRVSKNSDYIILIPDLQNYISEESFNKYLEKIIDWILQFNNAGFKVKAVLQVGDVTNFNSTIEWERAQKIFAKLDNKIDYILTTGNHDYGDNGICNNRNTHFSEYFNYKHNSSYISSFETGNYENTYFKVNIHNKNFQIFSLEFGPRNKVLAWADSIAKANSEELAMLMTHAYLYKDKERFFFPDKRLTQINSPHDYRYLYPPFGVGIVNDGEELWNKFLFPNSN